MYYTYCQWWYAKIRKSTNKHHITSQQHTFGVQIQPLKKRKTIQMFILSAQPIDSISLFTAYIQSSKRKVFSLGHLQT